MRDQLEGRPEVEVFLPLWERWSRWKDRKKKVQFPLFPGYCFARFRYGDRLQVLKAFGVVDLVGKGSPSRCPTPRSRRSAAWSRARSASTPILI